MNNNNLTLITLLLTPLLSFSQVDTTIYSKKELRKNRPTEIGASIGLNSSNLRDFATSPLIYKGTAAYFSISRIKSDLIRESEIGLSYSFGNFKNEFNNHSSKSKVKTAAINYSQLFEFNKLSSENLNVKIGGLYSATGNFRINEVLQNNALGAELFSTFFVSTKITKDVSREQHKDKKFLFIKYRLKPRTRNLAFRLNLGLINSTYRNGFVYSGQSGVLNEKKLFDSYQLKVFSGFRMSSALEYTIYLKNKNKIQLSYLWDAYKTGGSLDKFEMANHVIKLTLLFNTNNK